MESDIDVDGFQMNIDMTQGGVSEYMPSFRVVSKGSASSPEPRDFSCGRLRYFPLLLVMDYFVEGEITEVQFYLLLFFYMSYVLIRNRKEFIK